VLHGRAQRHDEPGGERTRKETQEGYLPNREEGGGGGLIGFEGVDMTTAKKIRTTVSVFELPQRLGVLQYVEYEPPPREWCAGDGCLYEGLLTAEGCKKGVCVRYRVWIYSKDRRRWEAKERWKRRDEDVGGCIKQQVADALWELSSQSDVGVWYRRVEEKRGIRYEVHVYCGPVVNGVELDQPQCRTVDECVKQILEEYRGWRG